MTEIETLTAQLQTALAKIAALETETAPLRAKAKEPAFDQKAFAQAFTRDPVGTMKRYGIERDYTTQVLVAQALRDAGQPVPANLEVASSMGPQIAAMDAVTAELAALRQRVEAGEKSVKGNTIRESLKIIASDKKKNPNLATAYAADPSLFDDDVNKHEGSAADLADALEKRLARQAKALGVTQSTSTEEVDASETAQRPKSTDGTAHASGSPAGNPPPLSKTGKKSGFTEDDARALRDEIVANADKGVYDRPTHPYRPQP